MPENDPNHVHARFRADQPLWVMVGPDGTLLAARHAAWGPVLLSWTTREELENGVGELFPQAPHLFASHTPEQRSFRTLLDVASRLRLRLRIDDYVVEDYEERSG